jgi:ADP-heptose:LPS heptosyltransferase
VIIISPYSKPLRSGNVNPKNYPYWKELLYLINDKHIIQVGVDGEKELTKDFRKNLSLDKLSSLIKECDYWISVDNFFQHLAYHVKKPGVVIWGKSDPNIFGYSKNLNILKDRLLLRPNQFDIWENCVFDPNVFLKPDEIVEKIKKTFN